MNSNAPHPSDVPTVLITMSLQSEYRSSGIGLARDFLEQVLPVVIHYRRAVGFFNSSVFGVAGKAWETFFQSGGVIQEVAGRVATQVHVKRLPRSKARWGTCFTTCSAGGRATVLPPRITRTTTSSRTSSPNTAPVFIFMAHSRGTSVSARATLTMLRFPGWTSIVL